MKQNLSISTIVITCLILMGWAFPSITVFGQSPGPVVTLQLNPGENNPRNSEGDFVKLKDGRILYIYSHFVGNSASDFGNSHLAARYSSDNGATWTTEDVIVVENEGAMNVMSVSLLRLQNGQIALFYARKNSIHDCIPYLRLSSDEGKTWSEPIRCIPDQEGYFVLNNARVIQLSGGRLLMPVAHHVSKVEPGSNLEHSFNNYGILYCYYSDDNGQTWKQKGNVPIPEGLMAQEPGVIEMKNGDVMMYIRTDSGVQYASYSKNKGKKWTMAIPTNIPSPLSPATIARIPATGDLLLVWNNNGVKKNNYRGKRTPLNVAISRNEGLTWENVKTLHDDPDGWYCYTSVRFINDSELLMSYCAGNRPAGTALSITNITKMNINWLYE